MSEANKQVVRRMVDAINARDLDVLDGLVAADVRRHSAATPGVVVENRDQFKAFLRQDLAAVPDSHQVIECLLAEDDRVAARLIYRGTQRGPLGPYPPSNRTVEVPFIGILRLEGGKVAEIWAEWDNLNMLAQLGHYAPPAEGAGGQ